MTGSDARAAVVADLAELGSALTDDSLLVLRRGDVRRALAYIAADSATVRQIRDTANALEAGAVPGMVAAPQTDIAIAMHAVGRGDDVWTQPERDAFARLREAACLTT